MGVVATNVFKKLLAMGLLMCCVAHAQTQSRPAVVELFTSEGCSSCPPAEAYIGELAQHKDVLALSFHVDYWDNLGWKDPFSLRISTERQSAYSKALGRSSVYTPQVVIDGKDDYVGTDRRNIGKALAAARTCPRTPSPSPPGSRSRPPRRSPLVRAAGPPRACCGRSLCARTRAGHRARVLAPRSGRLGPRRRNSRAAWPATAFQAGFPRP